MVRVILLAEAFSTDSPGGRSTLALARGLQAAGFDLRVATFQTPATCPDVLREEFSVVFLESGGLVRNVFKHFVPDRSVAVFRRLLDEFRPQIVHSASFQYGKSRFLIGTALAAGAKVVLEPWSFDAFCHQQYAFLDNHPCDACFGGNFLNAWRNGCDSGVRAWIHAVSRSLIRHSALASGVWFISTGVDMDERLVTYGVSPERIIRMMVPFNASAFEGRPVSDAGAFVFHGQITRFKGAHLLPEIMRLCPETRFEIYPTAEGLRQMRALGIDPQGHPNLRVISGLNWQNGLAEALARARGILVPSLWPTIIEIVVVEGLKLGKAVMVFAVGEHKQIFQDGENAMLADAGNVNEFAKRVRMVDTDATLRARLASNGSALYERLWAPAALRAHLLAAYGRLGERVETTRD